MMQELSLSPYSGSSYFLLTIASKEPSNRL